MSPMRRAVAIVANLVSVVGLAGCVLIGGAREFHLLPPSNAFDSWWRGSTRPPAAQRAPARTVLPPTAAPNEADPAPVETPAPPAEAEPTATPAPAAAEEPPAERRLPITRVEVPHLGMRADVVPAAIITVPGGTTWDVPPFVAGHGDNTAGAGEAGNAVLLGHVVSPNAGSVFKDLFRMRAGDQVRVFSDDREFDYVVNAVLTVSRTDLSVLLPTDSASVTLVTCTGTWLPALQDFSHRLAVRAELVSTPGSA
jgi:LPXTG-site transpeptidase (sortase) family protein